MRKSLLLIPCLSLLILYGCGKKNGSEGAQNFRTVPKVEVQQIQLQDVSYSFETVGTLEADEVCVQSPVEGVVTLVNFREGDSVKMGETILVEIDPEKFELNRKKAEADKNRTLAIYQKAVADYQKRNELFKKGVVTEDELISYRTTMKETQANYHEARTEWMIRRKEEREAKVKSPVTGVIQTKSVSLGMHLAPETKIAELIDLEHIRIQFSVTAAEAQKLSLDQEINFLIQTMPQIHYRAQIFFIRQYADPETRMILCKADHIRSLETRGIKDLKPGIFAQINIETHLEKNAIVIPQSSYLATEDGFKVFVAQGNTARERLVQIGLHTQEGQVEVLSGLNSGDILITRGAQALRDGMPIEITPSLPAKEN